MKWAPRAGLARLRTFLRSELWSFESERRSELRLVRVLQFCIMVAKGFVRDRLLLRASALPYFTVLSVVPLLAVAASIVSAVGVSSGGFVDSVVSTLAAGSPEAQKTIRELIARANFAGLGSLSAAMLFVMTVLAISNVERSLNEIWGVRKSRGWGRRFPDYLAVLTVGPLLGGAAISLSTTLQSEWLLQRMLQMPGFAVLYEFGLRQVPWVMLSLSLSFLYWFLPNTRVQPISALLGGVPAGVLTLAAQRMYLDFSVGAVRANAFFGGFATLPLLFLWIYVFWAIVLFGAEIAFAHQNLHAYRRQVRGRPAGAAERESVGLRVALVVARHFRDGAAPLDTGALSDILCVPVRTVREISDQFVSGGIFSVRLDEERGEGMQLGRPAERILLADILASLRGEREVSGGGSALGAVVDGVLREIDEGIAQGVSGRTLADLLNQLPPA